MSVATFKSTLWAKELLTELFPNQVWASLASRTYQSDVSNESESVEINKLTRVSITSYTPNSLNMTPETLTTGKTSLDIDQMHKFNFQVDDVDARQAAGTLLDKAARDAAEGLSETSDLYLSGVASSEYDEDNEVTGVPTDGEEVYEALVDLSVKLNGKNVPRNGRWAVLSPEFEGMLRKSDAPFIDASASGSTDPLINGFVGRAAGFNIHVSNNPGLTDEATPSPTIVAGHPIGIEFVEQLRSVEAYRPEAGFSDAIKGLYVFGAVVVRPEAIGIVQAS